LNRNRFCESKPEKQETKTEKLAENKEVKRLPSGSFIRIYLKKLFPLYYNLRYLNVFYLSKPGEIYKYSFEKYSNQRTTLFLEDSKFEELFELADKSEFLAASMLEIDLAEIISTDNFKENYTFTVNNILIR